MPLPKFVCPIWTTASKSVCLSVRHPKYVINLGPLSRVGKPPHFCFLSSCCLGTKSTPGAEDPRGKPGRTQFRTKDYTTKKCIFLTNVRMTDIELRNLQPEKRWKPCYLGLKMRSHTWLPPRPVVRLWRCAEYGRPREEQMVCSENDFHE